MKDVADMSAFDWITEGRTPPPRSYTPVPLSRILPLRFQRYANVLHSFHASYESIDRPLSPEEVRVLRLPECIALKNLVVEKRQLQPGGRIFWKEAADILGVPYTEGITHAWLHKAVEPTCWPRFINGPADGALLFEEARELASVLETSSPAGDCFFRLPEIPHIMAEQNLMSEGKVTEAPDFFSEFQFGPEYWWPEDHQWCVCSDYDLEFTVVGGSSELIDLLLQSKLLECIEVSSTIRVDSLGRPHS